jgi:hypothetical protein
MKHTIVTYTVKPGRADENAALVQAVIAELEERAPSEVSYACYRDGDSFTHVASYPDGTNPFADVAAFREFRGSLDDRTARPLVRRDVERVDAYVPAATSLPASVG